VLVKKEKPKHAAGATFLATPTVPKPAAGVAVHAKASLRTDAWGSSAGARATLGDGADDDKYVTESFTLGEGEQRDDAGAAIRAEGADGTEGADPGGSYARLARQGLDEEVINSSAVVMGAARPISPETARKRQFVREQVEASQDKECGICMELVLPKGNQFGLLDGCAHIFCVECIREWRSVNTLDKQVKRSCPLCRSSSHYVIPSSFVPPDDESKAEIIASYHERLTKIPCRHFNFGAGECP
jgi:hypothetical protein